MSNLIQKYLTQEEASIIEASMGELLVPSPCDTCVFQKRCADEFLACNTFSVFVTKQGDEHPELFLTNGSNRKPTREIYRKHFVYTGHRHL